MKETGIKNKEDYPYTIGDGPSLKIICNESVHSYLKTLKKRKKNYYRVLTKRMEKMCETSPPYDRDKLKRLSQGEGIYEIRGRISRIYGFFNDKKDLFIGTVAFEKKRSKKLRPDLLKLAITYKKKYFTNQER